MISDDTWTTKDGQEILITNLDDDHLLNIIKMLERNAPFYAAKMVMAMQNYADDAPDGAAMCAEQEADQIMRGDVPFKHQKLQFLLDEAASRGLEVKHVDPLTTLENAYLYILLKKKKA